MSSYSARDRREKINSLQLSLSLSPHCHWTNGTCKRRLPELACAHMTCTQRLLEQHNAQQHTMPTICKTHFQCSSTKKRLFNASISAYLSVLENVIFTSLLRQPIKHNCIECRVIDHLKCQTALTQHRHAMCYL